MIVQCRIFGCPHSSGLYNISYECRIYSLSTIYVSICAPLGCHCITKIISTNLKIDLKSILCWLSWVKADSGYNAESIMYFVVYFQEVQSYRFLGLPRTLLQTKNTPSKWMEMLVCQLNQLIMYLKSIFKETPRSDAISI